MGEARVGDDKSGTHVLEEGRGLNVKTQLLFSLESASKWFQEKKRRITA
jgi:hypothetical protein